MSSFRQKKKMMKNCEELSDSSSVDQNWPILQEKKSKNRLVCNFKCHDIGLV